MAACLVDRVPKLNEDRHNLPQIPILNILYPPGRRNTNLYYSGKTPDGLSGLLHGRQIGSQVGLFVLYAHLFSNVVSVSLNGFG
jgi:hypothetical protein